MFTGFCNKGAKPRTRLGSGMLKFVPNVGSPDGCMSPRWRALFKIFPRLSLYGNCRRFKASRDFQCNAERELAADFKASDEPKLKVPVLIVGAGPVGLSLSILLSKYGIRSTVVEQRSELSKHPQAHFINNRTMEIFRKMEGLESEIQDWQPPLDQWRKFVYCTTLSGPILGTVDHLQPQDTLDRRSPTSIAHFSQHRLLRLLFKRAQKLSFSVQPANNINADLKLDGILLGHRLVSLHANANGAIGRISTSAGSLAAQQEIECSYLVATDGARSSVRGFMGVGMQGEVNMQNLISVHFLSTQLGRHLLINQPGMLYFVFNTRVIAVIVAHNLQLGEFIAQIPYYPPQQGFEDFTEEVCREIISDAAGIPNLEMEVKTVKEWVMDAQVADTFICGHGRVILAGDAAHCFPPAGGFGMNTGIQDVHNLAWKLAAILNGSAPPDLLFTYESERHPIAKANTALSVANFKAAMAIPVALGLNPSSARWAQQVVSSGASWLPRTLQGAILDGFFTIGRLQVSPVLLNQFNPLGYSRIARVKQILHEGHSLQLQFPAEDLGFRYQAGAILPEKPNPDEQKSNCTMGRRHEYVPSTQPGARLPHCFLSNLCPYKNQSTSKAIFSTLDLISSDRPGLLLIIGPGRSGCHWADAALQAAKTCRIPMKVAVVWPKGSSQQLWASLESATDYPPGLTEEESYVVHEWGHQNQDNVIQVEDIFGSWWELCRVPLSGAILVRPDDHISWRTTEQADNHYQASIKLERVLKIMLRQEGYNELVVELA